MRSRDESSSFNLPIFLSFNELAWIAVFAVVLFWVAALSKGNAGVVSPERPAPATTKPLARQPSDDTITNRYSRAQHELASLSDAFAKSTNDLALALRDLSVAVGERDAATTKAARLVERLVGLETRAILDEKTNQFLERSLNDLSRSHTRLAEDLARCQGETLDLRDQLRRSIGKALLGLQGGLTNVVILLDCSSSMAQKDLWPNALEVVQTWLRLLPIERCAFITFNDRIQSFPADGSLLTVSGASGGQARTNMLRSLENLVPTGLTDLEGAIEKAYEYKRQGADSIILFTDGAPHPPRPAGHASRVEANDLSVSKQQIKKVHALCQNRRDMPINPVAVGHYFVWEQAKFLRQLAAETGGTFIGR